MTSAGRPGFDADPDKIPFAGVAMLAGASKNTEYSLKKITENRIDTNEEAFTKIMAATGISDLDLLLKTFIQTEEKNFALFKFVNEQNTECENLENQVFEMQTEIDKSLQEGGHSNKRNEVQKLQKKLTSTNYEIGSMEKVQVGNAAKIIKVKGCIQKISKVVECDET